MRRTKIIAGVLLLSLVCNIYQWRALVANKQTKQTAQSWNMTALGSDLIAANSSIDDILTDTNDMGFQYGRVYTALNDASLRAAMPSVEVANNDVFGHKIGISLEQADHIVGQLFNKDPLDENDIDELNSIQEMLAVYIEMLTKSNANTGYVDDQSLQKAGKAAEQFNQLQAGNKTNGIQ